jgi:glycerol transport system ATP-binding protein
MSGLLVPSQGTVLFDGRDVTRATPQQRNIAQVFQFPVIYDTMTVAENLAFPLRTARCRRRPSGSAWARSPRCWDEPPAGPARRRPVGRPEAEDLAGPRPGAPDVSAVLFDEPLTVIDPHLKWQLRRKLKQIHHELKLTLIYVTHDQVEALTFADQVVVMSRGRVMQLGTPDALFERPAHTFVGHFIGSPGMNFLPVTVEAGELRVDGRRLAGRELPAGALRLGIRPEYLRLQPAGEPGALPATVRQVQDIGTYLLVTLEAAGHTLKARLPAEAEAPAVGAQVGAAAGRTPATTATRSSSHERSDQTGEPAGLVPDPAGDPVRGLLGHPAADDGGQLLGAGHHRPGAPRLRRHRVVRRRDARRGAARALWRQLASRWRCWRWRFRWASPWRCPCRPQGWRPRWCW